MWLTWKHKYKRPQSVPVYIGYSLVGRHDFYFSFKLASEFYAVRDKSEYTTPPPLPEEMHSWSKFSQMSTLLMGYYGSAIGQILILWQHNHKTMRHRNPETNFNYPAILMSPGAKWTTLLITWLKFSVTNKLVCPVRGTVFKNVKKPHIK